MPVRVAEVGGLQGAAILFHDGSEPDLEVNAAPGHVLICRCDVVDLEDDFCGRLVAWLIGLGVEGDADRSTVEEGKFRRLGRELEPDTVAVEGNRFGHVQNAEDDVGNLHIGNASSDRSGSSGGALRYGVVRYAPIALVVAVVAAGCSTPDAQTTTASPAAPAQGVGDETSTSTIIEVIPPEVERIPLSATPSQQEGPYYPVQRFDDQDNDLTVIDGVDGSAAGNVLMLSGTLLTTDGAPVVGGVVEIWQTDANGVYLHPRAPGVADRDAFFQGSGAATTATDGSWSFRTIDPGYYEPRPRHIHVKVHVDGQEVLITQIYFSDDAQADAIDERLVADITNDIDDQGAPVLVAEHRIVLEAR